ncbi:PHP domain-containing protein [Abyssicoccus albus]|uniref:PHP domain-containing protein n=1 Tax=Abyssicoccus albus TaxID=1817405 RepID=UPI00097E302A|nr:PHP domain-containing protein [Abyssicoccus albus]AQL56832.1 hypothetical protein BVH56_07860 [Abyssicoccus albus]
MTIDIHIHLDEGPYNNEYLKKIFHHFLEKKDSSKTSDVNIKLNDFKNIIKNNGYDKTWFDLYLEKAVEKNLKVVGIVDHMYRFKEFKHYFQKHIVDEVYVHDKTLSCIQADWLDKVCVTSFNQFKDFIQGEKQKWKDHGIELLYGLEVDFFSGEADFLKQTIECLDLDYTIGSVHFYKGFGFDNPTLKHYFNQLDLNAAYTTHFETILEMIRANIVDIIAHVDNLKVFQFEPSSIIKDKYFKQISLALNDTDTIIEWNSGLKYRYPVQQSCPSQKDMEYFIQNKITLSSDSHLYDDIGYDVELKKNYLKKLGVNEVYYMVRKKEHAINL